jgi:hypothetical protein
MSLKEIALNYIKSQYPKIVHKGEIGKLAVNEWGYLNENVGRRLRELQNSGAIEVIYNEKHEAQYRWIPPKEFIQPNPIFQEEIKSRANTLFEIKPKVQYPI